MLFHPHRALRAALVLLPVAGASLAGATPAAGQGYGLQPPRLRNEAEVARQSAALYPAALRDGRVEGQVFLKFRVLADSTVDSASVSVLEASNAAFVEPAKALTRTMRFAPARMDGQAVAVWIRHPVDFRVSAPPYFRAGAQASPDEGLYELSAVEEPPRLRNAAQIARDIEARYPPALRDAGISGDVVVRTRVLEDGTVDSATAVAVLSTDPAFEEPAVAGVLLMRLTPARVNGRPVKVWIEVPIHFGIATPPPVPPSPPASPGERE